MSLTRQFFREMRPLFRILEEPLGRTPSAFSGSYPRSVFDDPFFRNPGILQPAVDVTEEGTKYVIEAELPGVMKENINVRIGDAGRSITIEGKAVNRRSEPQPAEASSATSSLPGSTAQSVEGQSNPTTMTQPSESTELSTECLFTSNTSFTRTVHLPRAVDANNVSAKLADGILTITVSKAEDPAAVQVNID